VQPLPNYFGLLFCVLLRSNISYVVVVPVCALVSFSLESGTSDVNWIKFNANMTGVYRVQYDDDNWRALIAQLKQDHSVCTSTIFNLKFASSFLFNALNAD